MSRSASPDATETSLIPPECRLVVFDVDGTLYRQGPVRRAMLRELLTRRAGPGGIGILSRLRILRRFRRLRERMAADGGADFDTRLFEALSRETGRPVPVLRGLVREWMEERPLRYLAAAMVPGAARLFELLASRGIPIAVWSDYPVPEKLAAMGLRADHHRAATDGRSGGLKPDPTGLSMLLDAACCPPEQAVMIGDRMSRDGRAAEALGVPFILLGRERAPAGVTRLPDFRPLVARLEAGA